MTVLINIYTVYRQIDYFEGGVSYRGVVLELPSPVLGDTKQSLTRFSSITLFGVRDKTNEADVEL